MVLGSRTAEMAVTRTLSTRGMKVYRPAKAHGLGMFIQNVMSCSCRIVRRWCHACAFDCLANSHVPTPTSINKKRNDNRPSVPQMHHHKEIRQTQLLRPRWFLVQEMWRYRRLELWAHVGWRCAGLQTCRECFACGQITTSAGYITQPDSHCSTSKRCCPKST